MEILANYVGAQRSLEGDLCVMLTTDDDTELEWLEKNKGNELVVDIQKFNPKRSLSANAYFWKLCNKLAKALGSDKDTVYLMMLRYYGVFDYVEVIKEGIPALEKVYKICDEDYSYSFLKESENGYEEVTMVGLKCYLGSSQYDTAEMSRLIEGTLSMGEDIGVNWFQEEIDYLVSMWEARQ